MRQRIIFGGALIGVAPFCLVILVAVVVRSAITESAASRAPEEVGNEACGTCHRAIVDRYSQTAMARTSGPAEPHLIEGAFHHAPSDVSYRVYREGETAFLAYERSGPSGLHGRQQLKYYVGSNTRGRTFLFDIDGFLYQSPINYFAAKHVWDMSPGYGQLRAMELNHPVDATCLFCHASRVQSPVTGTVNRFAGEPFLQAGVSCERCHGPGSEHAAGRGSMVNPAKLTGERRDGICMQCHLEGVARITRAGRHQQDYAPGAILSDSLAIFVPADAATQDLGAVSQVEALARSRCKLPSGDRLSCITCHDPHRQVTGTEKAGYYRARCIGCHAPKADHHYQEQQDCTTCHMPRADSADIGHTMVTDHRIVRTPRPSSGSSAIERLVQFDKADPDARDLGLAYGEVALRGNAFAAREAMRLLEQALPEHDDDVEVLTRLGYLYQSQGDLDRAAALYDRALKRDPDRGLVATNLGVFYARRGLLPRALTIWREAFDMNPQLTDLGLNLARGLCADGRPDDARQVVRRALDHNPDAGPARLLLSELNREEQCHGR
jgi:Tfp pilus assembly protein PilF